MGRSEFCVESDQSDTDQSDNQIEIEEPREIKKIKKILKCKEGKENKENTKPKKSKKEPKKPKKSRKEPNDVSMKLQEKFNADKLAYIVNNEDIFKPQLNTKHFLNNYNPFKILNRYLTKSTDGVIQTEYLQKGGSGRFVAIGGLSLQALPKSVRHTIAGDFYNDIDIVNCHPVLLESLSLKRGINCPALTYYNNNREAVINDISKGDLSLRNHIKQIIIKIINGGYHKTENTWLISFKTEIKLIHDKFGQDPGFDSFKDLSIENGNTKNLEARYINKLLCELENNILIRPLGNVIFINPPYSITEIELKKTCN